MKDQHFEADGACCTLSYVVHSNRRWRWIRVVGLVVCAALAAICCLDPYWSLYHAINGNTVTTATVYGSGIEMSNTSIPPPTEFVNYVDFSRVWRFYAGFGPGEFVIFVPLWIPFLAIALPTAYAWYRCRRFGPGRCSKCGYDLAGIMTGVCPECGGSTAAASGTRA